MKCFKEVWSMYPANPSFSLNARETWLSERCVLTTKGDWYVKRSANDSWAHVPSKKAAFVMMTENWVGGPHMLTNKDIADFMDGRPPVVVGTYRVPTTQAPLIEMSQNLYLNSWQDTILKPNVAALADPVIREGLTLFVRMIRVRSRTNRII